MKSYQISLLLALPLMLFFGFHMLSARTPDSRTYRGFLLSRRLMGTALLLLSVNYSVHLYCGIRQKDLSTTILMNLATYFLCYWLFSSSLMTLLVRAYITVRRFVTHILLWVVYCLSAFVVLIKFHDSIISRYGLFLLAMCVVAYGLFLSYRLLRTYYRAVRMFDNTHSDDIGAYIRWLSIFTWWAIIFGVSCALLTFLPDRYIYLWILSSIPFYIYLYCCYQNYMLFYEKVENAISDDCTISTDDNITLQLQDNTICENNSPAYHAEIARRIEEWKAADKFCRLGLTLQEMAAELGTNRTYLSEYINTTCHVTFREWIASLRIDYSKRMMQLHPKMRILDISKASGYLSLSNFTSTFKEIEGCSPSNWKKNNVI